MDKQTDNDRSQYLTLSSLCSGELKMAGSSPKRVENTVGKGEIARYEQCLLFPQCFQKACFPVALNGVIVWEWVLWKNKITRQTDRQMDDKNNTMTVELKIVTMRCVCETLMSLKHPSFEKHDPDI